MDNNRSRTGILIGVAAAAGAFGVAALMSVTTAPAARADVYSEIIGTVDAYDASGQAEFTRAFSDFGNSDVNDGLAAFFSGVNNDFLAAPGGLYVGTVDLLTDETLVPVFEVDVPPVSDFTSASSDAESYFAVSQGYLTIAGATLSEGSYAYAADDEVISSFFAVAGVQLLLEGAVASF
jgi:hypothetical protein